MKVISLKSNSRLVKGSIYDTDWFNNKRIHIKGYGGYLCKNFTTTNGDPIPNTVYDRRSPIELTKIEDVKIGDVIVCKNERYAHLISGGKYRISDIRERQVKLEGYNRWLTWGYGWNFRKLSLQESRDLKLSQVLDREENFSVNKKRKIDQKENVDNILIETIAKSIIDRYRNNLDIIEWGISKNSKSFKIKREDFDHLMDKPLSEILKIAENK